jgi:hypothetical membrane protein
MHTVTRPSAPPWATPLAIGGPVAVFLAILALHAIKPEYHPSWRFISEYAIGPWGWVMQLTFVVWAVSCATLAVAARPEVHNRRGRAGVVLLWVVAVALVVAGIFPQDPVTSQPSEATTAGMMHAIASSIGIPGIPIAAMLIISGLKAGRRDSAALPVGLRASAHATWVSLLLMVLYLMWQVPRAGGFTAEVWAGWMNRLVVSTYLIWQLLLARHLARHAHAAESSSASRVAA